ncbi:MAG: nitrilase [Alphaproteobacteria bacterium]|nr:MAG: nitrilase [Alphaproteobacteria bacterium]
MAKNSSEPPRYIAIALQLKCFALSKIKAVDAARAQIMKNVQRAADYVTACTRFAKFFHGIDCRLIVLPEFVLTSFPIGESHDEWRAKAALESNGPEFEVLQKTAQENKLFLAGNAYEIDPHFPELYFQTCFIIGPNGDIILRYRRLTSTFEPTPHDIWDRYLDVYGLEGVFPVVRTEIGNLAAVSSEEIQWPEITRCHVMRGAEVIIHPTSETGTPLSVGRDICKRARAVENMVYVVSANTASLEGMPIPAFSCTGMSKIIDFTGNVMTEAAPGGESHAARSILDIGALRQARRSLGMTNFLSRQPFDAYAESYANTQIHVANTMLQNGEIKVPQDREFFNDRQRDNIRRMEEQGVI